MGFNGSCTHFAVAWAHLHVVQMSFFVWVTMGVYSFGPVVSLLPRTCSEDMGRGWVCRWKPLSKQQQWLWVEPLGEKIQEFRQMCSITTCPGQQNQRDPFQAMPPAPVDIEWPKASTRHLQAGQTNAAAALGFAQLPRWKTSVSLWKRTQFQYHSVLCTEMLSIRQESLRSRQTPSLAPWPFH